ncbi:MAG TPA: hypothetical protein VJO13_08110 [Ktedonobacterales bacterium]|nr:hypothetical protein [Ktedonobacterales bacterium]
MSGIRQCGGAMVARVRADHLAKEKGPAARWGTTPANGWLVAYRRWD